MKGLSTGIKWIPVPWSVIDQNAPPEACNCPTKSRCTNRITQIARFMGPIWGRQDPGGPHVGPMNLAISAAVNTQNSVYTHIVILQWRLPISTPNSEICTWHMMTSSNWNVFSITGHLCGNSPVTGEFPAQRPVTRSFDVFFDLRLNKRLSK